MPLVSIIVPCYNEQSTIRLLLDAILCQTYPIENLEVILADGMSEDGTREQIAVFQHEHPELHIQVIDNPKRNIPAGLNCGLSQAKGDIIIRLDAHSMPYPEYIERCVTALDQGAGENVGGVWEIRPGTNGWLAKAIAVAASHRLGVGDALYRFTSQAREVDTVPFGAFRRVTFDQIGQFDETLLTNEDYEFNARLRQNGGQVWLDPSIRSVYFARPDLSSLARQYFRYGFWKWRMLRRYPKTLRLRQALPPLLVISLVGLLILSIWVEPLRWLLGLEIILYLSILFLGTARAALLQQKDARLLVGIPAAIVTMHLSWGAGFLWSIMVPKQ